MTNCEIESTLKKLKPADVQAKVDELRRSLNLWEQLLPIVESFHGDAAPEPKPLVTRKPRANIERKPKAQNDPLPSTPQKRRGRPPMVATLSVHDAEQPKRRGRPPKPAGETTNPETSRGMVLPKVVAYLRENGESPISEIMEVVEHSYQAIYYVLSKNGTTFYKSGQDWGLNSERGREAI